MPAGYFIALPCTEFQLPHEYLSDAILHVARGGHSRVARMGFAGAAYLVDTAGFASVAFGGDGGCAARRLHWRFHRCI